MRIFSGFTKIKESKSLHSNQNGHCGVAKTRISYFEWAYTNMNKVSKTLGMAKIINPCVEGDRSDCKP